MKLGNLRRKSTFRGIVLLAILAGIIWFIPPVWDLSGDEISVTQWRRNGGEITASVGRANAGEWIRIHQVSRHVLHAIIVSEDARFYDHWGLDFEEISKSLELNLKKGRYARGASTITQQVVKVAFLGREKSLIRKAREAVGALLLEQVLLKDQILEWYINLVEFGDGIYGIKAAAKHYFDTKPELLTISQATHLALVLPSPNGWSIGLRRKRLTEFGHERFAQIIRQMRLHGYITDGLWVHALATGDFGRPIRDYETLASNKEAPTSKAEPSSKEETLRPLLDEYMESKQKEETSDEPSANTSDRDAP